MTSRRHHFLPESYLKHWIDPQSSKPASTPVVWCCTRDGHIKSRPPASDSFWREYSNSVIRADGSKDDRIEKLLGRIEGVVYQATRGTMARHEPVDRDVFDAVNMFFASMLVRVPSVQVSLQATYTALAEIERAHAVWLGRSVSAD